MRAVKKFLPRGLVFLFSAILMGTSLQGREWTGSEQPTVEQCRQDWTAKTKGNNLARGVRPWLSSVPNWKATRGEDDAEQLTDGAISSSASDNILNEKSAVAWQRSGPHVILFDLGSEKNISRLVVRCLGGGEHSMTVFPEKFEVIASDDGQSFRSVSSMYKLLPGDKEGADWVDAYFLPEEGEPYTFAFALPAEVKARFVGLRIEIPGIFLVIDEVAVMGAEDDSPVLSQYPKTSVLVDRIGIFPRTEKLWISENIVTPNWLVIEDTRTDKAGPPPVLTVDLPGNIQVLGWGWDGKMPQVISRTGADGDPSRHTWELPVLLGSNRKMRVPQGPLYLRMEEAVPRNPESQSAVFTTVTSDGRQYEKVLEIDSLAIPFAGEWNRETQISLGWLWESYALTWPDFLETYRHLGFNHVPTFPRFGVDMKSSLAEDISNQERMPFLDAARKAGFGIIYNESPFHVMQGLWARSNPEILNLVGNKVGKHLSPVYRGPKYQEEIDRVAGHFAKVKADVIFWDIELWYRAVLEARSSALFQHALKKSGLPEDAFLRKLGREMLVDLREAVNKAAGAAKIPIPQIGMYNLHPQKPNYHFVFQWADLYPDGIDFAMPSLYVQGNAAKIHDTIRGDYEALRQNRLVPWLTAGTYGEFSSEKMEPMIYETFLNGASGMTYFTYTDFDPRDFFYHAKALATLAPYQKLLRDGKPGPLSGSNPDLFYSAWVAGAEGLILVGNYSSNTSQTTTVTLPLPLKTSQKLTDLRRGEAMTSSAGKIELNVPGGDCVLLHIGK